MSPDLLGLLRDSVTVPREAAARLVAWRPPRATVLEGAVLVSALGALLEAVPTGLALLPLGAAGEVTVAALPYALVLLASLLVSAVAIHTAGGALGGRGTFDQALAVVVWLDAVALAVRVGQLVAAALVPPLAPVVDLLALLLLLWCLASFVRVLHGFSGLGRAVATVLLGGLGVGMGLTLILGLVGGLAGGPDV